MREDGFSVFKQKFGRTSRIDPRTRIFSTIPIPLGAGIAKGWMTDGLEFESRWGQELSLLHVVQNGSGVRPASYPMGIGGALSPRIKRPGREADHSPPTSDEVKKNVDQYIHSPIRLQGAVLN
jgi:hypothetical protein